MPVEKLNMAPLAGPTRGRPRSAECDDAILTATWRLLGEVGYVRLSMEGIAAEAGVGKPTLYLRYAGKADVVAAAFARARMQRAPVPTGDLRADMVAQLEHIRATMEGVGMALVGTCLAEEVHVPDLIELLRERSLRPGRQVLRDILRAGVDRGELPPDADIETGILMAVGSYYAQRIAGEEFDEDWGEHVADATLAMLRGAWPADVTTGESG